MHRIWKRHQITSRGISQCIPCLEINGLQCTMDQCGLTLTTLTKKWNQHHLQTSRRTFEQALQQTFECDFELLQELTCESNLRAEPTENYEVSDTAPDESNIGSTTVTTSATAVPTRNVQVSETSPLTLILPHPMKSVVQQYCQQHCLRFERYLQLSPLLLILLLWLVHQLQLKK